MHVLVTGGCGYIGTMLVRRLLAEGHQVTVADLMWFGNYLEPHPRLTVIQEDVRNAERIPMRGVNALIHLANVANDPCSDLNPKLSWEVNVLATMQLVEAAIAAGVSQFIYASSGSVYGVKDEDEVTEDLSLVPISDYNKTKMISERVLLSYADRILVQCLRPATVCGYSPRMRLDLSVNLLTMQALTRGRITVLGGAQTRPNIHLVDMVGVYLHLLKMGKAMQGVYNAGFENISIMDIAKRVTQHVPADIEVKPSNDPRSYRLTSRKLLATGFKPQSGVEQAILELVAQYKAGALREDDIFHNIRTMKKMSAA
ncbi:MAG: SDR family oxidoreductase [Lentisphaerae bacterium]|nr:SDR family oxidoreductase [Lentisphaerota bacterium]